MWHRLKNSLLAMSISALAVIAVSGTGTWIKSDPAPIDAAQLAQQAVSRLDPEAQIAFQIGVQLAALALDESIRQRAHATTARPTPPQQVVVAQPRMRMPFYSFAARVTRSGEES